MQLIFDRGTSTQRAVEVAFFGENVFRGSLNASNSLILADGASVSVPDLSPLRDNPSFTTVEVVDGSISVPLQGEYNTVLDASAAYNSTAKQYSVTVILGKQ